MGNTSFNRRFERRIYYIIYIYIYILIITNAHPCIPCTECVRLRVDTANLSDFALGIGCRTKAKAATTTLQKGGDWKRLRNCLVGGGTAEQWFVFDIDNKRSKELIERAKGESEQVEIMRSCVLEPTGAVLARTAGVRMEKRKT